MSEEQTCGKGLAEHSALPAKLAALTASMAALLAAHQHSIDVADENGRQELKAYVRLEEEHRMIASLLEQTAKRMAGYRELPMARHDLRVLASAENAEAFAKLVKVEQELADLLRGTIARQRQMLGQTR
jgi:hypothetical protein